MSSSVDVTLVVTALMAAIFHMFYRQLRREEFLRWWAWAWTVYSASIAARWAAAQHPAVAAAWFVTGWVHAALLLRGALAVWGKPWPRRLPWSATLVLAAGLGLGNYFWARATREEILIVGLRAALFGVIYWIAAYAFYHHWRTSRCSATLVTLASCALRGAQFLLGAWANTQPLLNRHPVVVWVHTFGGLVSLCGIGLGVIMLLIQEYRDAERKLLASRERYRQMVETANEGIVLNDAEGRVIFANQRFAEMLRVPFEELEGKRPGDLGLLDDESVALIEREREKRRHGLTSRYELCFRRAPNEDLCCVVSAAPIHDENHRFTGSLVMLTDITNLKRAERALRSSEMRYRELFENAGDLVATSDLDGNITSWNNAGERITGYSAEDALRMKVRDLAVEQHRPLIEECLLDPQREGRAHVDARTKDGHTVKLEISYRTMYDGPNPVGKQAIARDVTARLQGEAQLRQSQKMEAVGRLAGGIAHDFNNALCVIVGFSDLELSRDDLDADRQYHVEQIKEAALQAGSLTHQLLAFSRQQVLEPKVLDLNGVVSNLMRMLPRLIGEDIQLFFMPATGLWNVEADPGQMEQVVMNLVVNARDAMPEGGTLTLETGNAEPKDCLAHQYCCPHVPPGYYVMLAVRDTGIGMDEETKARMFEPFFTTKEKGKGTGLGLATVYGIVEQSGGHMCVRSAPGQGSSFEIYLPRAVQPVERPVFESAEPAPRGSETILLMEDEPALRRMVAEILGRSGYHVLAPASTVEALELAHCHSEEIHLFFTDLVLPHKSGAQLAAEAAALRPGMKVLYTSGYSDDRIAHQGLREPDEAFLRKPFTGDQLLRKIREVLDREERECLTASGKCAGR